MDNATTQHTATKDKKKQILDHWKKQDERKKFALAFLAQGGTPEQLNREHGYNFEIPPQTK